MNRLLLLLAVIITLTWSAGARAENYDAALAPQEEEAEPLNSLGISGGVTITREKPGAGTLGVEYTRAFRRQDRRLPVYLGVIGEMVFEDKKEYLLILVGYWQPPRTRAWLSTGPGLEWSQEESPDAGHEGFTDTKTDFLYRFGTGYAMEMGGGLDLVPSLNFDLVRSTVAVVFAFTVEYSF